MKYVIDIPKALHQDTAELVVAFAEAMAVKLRSAEIKHGFSNGWKSGEWKTDCKVSFIDHILKGDPVDVANYCAFMFYHGWDTKIQAVLAAEERKS